MGKVGVIYSGFAELGLSRKEDVLSPINYFDNLVWKMTRLNQLRSLKTHLAEGRLYPEEEVVKGSGYNLLHQSIALNKQELFVLLLLYKADVNKVTAQGMRPLDIAVSLGRLKMVEELIGHGAEHRYLDVTGRTPAQRAELYGYYEIGEYLDSL